MSTYVELMAQAQALMAKAEQARKTEVLEAIAEIKAKMKEYGITAADLGGTAGAGRGRKAKPGAADAKFRGPDGELWSGGPGRKPDWVRKVLAEGGDIEKYRI